MVTGREIVEPGELRFIRPASHIRREVSDVDAVFAHIEEDERLGGAGIDHIGFLEINAPGVVGQAKAVAAKAADPEIHGHAADAGHGPALEGADGRLDAGSVGGAFPDGGIGCVIPEWASLDVLFDIPIRGIGGVEVHETKDPGVRVSAGVSRIWAGEEEPTLAVVGVHPPG